MLGKLLGAFGKSSQPPKPPQNVAHAPYADAGINHLYNLLFCDDIELFRGQNGAPQGLWATLFGEPPDIGALRQLAEDGNNEGRVRALAYLRLRNAGESVPPKKLFCVIVEVPLDGGLDVLAAFSDGGVRYLNQTGKASIVEGAGNPVEPLARELMAAGQTVVDRIGPWDRPRLPPPKLGNVRISFVVSDGLYFGEGKFETLQQDAMAGPLLAKATELLQRVVALPRS